MSAPADAADEALVIDAHQHIWDLARSDYSWLSGLAPIDRTMTMEDLRPVLRRHGVTATVLVQSDDTDGDTDLMLEAAASDPMVVGVVAFAPLHDAGAAERRLAALAGPVVGVRNLAHMRADPEWMIRPGFLDGLAVLERAHLTFDLVGILPAHLEQAAAIADAFPDLTIVLDHLGRPPIGADAREPWWGAIGEAARRPNVYAKLSGLYSTVGDSAAWTPDGIRPFIDRALDVFGAHRLMIGGDWPIVELAGGYDRAMAALRSEVAGLSADERRRVLAGSAIDAYRLDQGRTDTAWAAARTV